MTPITLWNSSNSCRFHALYCVFIAFAFASPFSGLSAPGPSAPLDHGDDAVVALSASPAP